VATKPTDDYLWAESPPAPTDVVNPTAIRSAGWSFQSPIPFNWHNYLLRALGRWTDFFSSMFSSGGDLTLDAENGYVELVADPPNVGAGLLHIYRHVATPVGVASQWQADSIRGLSTLQAGDAAILEPTTDDVGLLSVLEHKCASAGVSQLRADSVGVNDETPGAVGLLRTDALYLGNLVKATAGIAVTWNGSGVPSVSYVAGYNTGNPVIVAAAGPFVTNGISLDATDDYTARVPTISASPAPADMGTPFIVYITPTISASTPWRISLLTFTGGAWVDALATTVALANKTVNLYMQST
jgi:hypothetical protein